MRSILLFAIFLGVVSGLRQDDSAGHKAFVQWIMKHSKSYSTQEEYVHRYNIFRANTKYIEEWNSNPSSTFTLGMNQFGDLTHQEFQELYLRKRIPTTRRRDVAHFENVGDLPASWDWRKQGGVTAVGNQEQCGSCWAFSITGSVEGCHKVTTGKLIALSQQQLLDCDTTDEGCNGGLMDNGFQYIMKNGGIDSLACYPYQGQDGNTCLYNNSTSCCASTVTGFKDVTAGSESALLAATYLVPVAIALDASQQSFQFYTDGVYYEPACSTSQLDHSALTVGWGATSNGTEYWIVKNSWGTTWGNKGYILMSRNRGNNCGIATEASYATGCGNCA